MEVEIYGCPFCGWNHSKKQSRKRPERGGKALTPEQTTGFSFSKIDPNKVLVYQRRRMSGAGRRSPNASIETLEALHLADLPDDLKDEIRQQARIILDILG